MNRSPGTRVAHYRLIRLLGAGGMGEVYLAQDTRLDRQVAIKFLTAGADSASRRRLLREARAVAALEHPSIVSIFEIGSDPSGGDFIVMAYVHGETLAARIGRGALSVGDTLALGANIASALGVAHRRSIVHRDLKPQNIILTPAGLPILLDFGLAKHADGSAEAAEALTVSQVTETDAIVGTAGYMSPEQLRGGTVDGRSDLFALGCVLYECLAGQRAFAGSSKADVLGQILHVQPPPPSSIRPDADTRADAICERLLQKSPANRYQSADEALGAIRATEGTAGRQAAEPARTSEPVELPRVSAPGRRRLIVASVLVLVAIGGVLGRWQWQRSGGTPAASPSGMRSYNLALEALREGSYQVAEGNLLEVVRLDPDFSLAYVRLAEAYSELEKLSLAKDALVRVGRLVPNRSRLGAENALRLRAVEAFVLREHDDSIAAYRQLAERNPKDPGGWLDLGRAEDSAGRRVAARQHFEQARDLDSQYAPARVRLGTLLGQLGRLDAAVAEFDEAIRIYRTASNSEGLAEAMVRKGTALTWGTRYPAARTTVADALALTVGPQFAYQRVRAMFDQARLTSVDGKLTEAMTIGAKAVDEAKAAGLPAAAATGLRDMGATLTFLGRHDDADRFLNEAIALAGQTGVEPAEMRARLQQASLRYDQVRYRDALDMSEQPLKFFTAHSYPRNAAEAQIIRARAFERLEQFAEAESLTRNVLSFAEEIKDDALVATSLENLVGQLESLGRLPDALRDRIRADAIYRSQKNHSSLAFSLVNQANLLNQLGRVTEAGKVLDELEQRISEGAEAYLSRRTRGKLARALGETFAGRYGSVAAPASQAQVEARNPGASGSAVSAALQARVLAEHAAARLGRSRTPVATILSWPAAASSPGTRREISYWVAQTLLLRRDAAGAAGVATAAAADPGTSVNAEITWRLASVAARALAGPDPSRSATIRATANAALNELRKTWDAASLASYLARADFVGMAER